MAIQVLEEDVVPLEDAKKLLPGRPDRSTIYRWALGSGSYGVKLESAKVGRKRFTSAQAIQRFVEAVTAAADGQAPPSIRTGRQRHKEMRAAERRLADAGI
jgi:hypothetical protein